MAPSRRAARWGRTGPIPGAVGSAALVVVALALALVAGACTSDSEPEPPPVDGGTAPTGTAVDAAGTLRLAVAEVDDGDPVLVSPTSVGALVVVDLLFDSLTTIDPATNEAVAAVAGEWSLDEAGTTWTFELDPEARFSDGTAVTADDVVFTITRVADRGVTSLVGARLDIIDGYAELVAGDTDVLAGVTAPSPSTVQIVTTIPYAGLPELLANPVLGIVPKAEVERAGPDFARRPVGSGPFALAEGQSLEPFGVASTDALDLPEEGADGAGDAAAEPAPAGVEGEGPVTVRLERVAGSSARTAEVDLLRYANEDGAWGAFEAGEADWATVPASRANEEVPGTQRYPYAAELFYGFNLDIPALEDARFRQAIVKAVDRQAIATEILGATAASNGAVPEGVPGAVADPCGEPCSYDPERARALVAEVHPDGDVPAVAIDTYTDQENPTQSDRQQAVANRIVADLQAVGIPAELRSRPFEEYRGFAVSGEQEVFSYGWVGVSPDPDSYLAPLFATGSVDNVFDYSNPAVDVALGFARAAEDRTVRLDAYGEVEKVVMPDVPILPLASVRLTVGVADSVQDLQVRLNGTFDTETVWVQP